MKKTLFAMSMSMLVATMAASAQQPAAPPHSSGNVVNMAGAPETPPVAGAKVLMLRTFASDLERSSKFYHEVFGMNALGMPGFGAPRPGGAAKPSAMPGPGTIRILTFPGGSPGMILIKGSGDATMLRGSYIIQVPDLKAALAAAEANGGKVQPTRFTSGSQESRHVLDPDGNDLEILQSGVPPKKAGQ